MPQSIVVSKEEGREKRENLGKFMTKLEINEDALIVHNLGWEQLWAFKSRIEVPLPHVASAGIDPEIARREWKGIKVPGTELPGAIIKSGTFYRGLERVFWDVHD